MVFHGFPSFFHGFPWFSIVFHGFPSFFHGFPSSFHVKMPQFTPSPAWTSHSAEVTVAPKWQHPGRGEAQVWQAPPQMAGLPSGAICFFGDLLENHEKPWKKPWKWDRIDRYLSIIYQYLLWIYQLIDLGLSENVGLIFPMIASHLKTG